MTRRTRAYGAVALILFIAFLTKEVLTTNGVVPTADLWFENLMVSIRTSFLLRVFDGVTFFGSPPFVIGVAGVVAATLFLKVKWRRAYFSGFVSTLSGAAISLYVMKELVGRARPGGIIPSYIETDFSFPSGHATASMAFYGFMIFLAYRIFPQHRRLTVLLGSAIILIVGFSRLYLGVHFPSDVIAGYALGGLWLLFGIEIVSTKWN